jgi:N-acetylmuramoyl-L-alanine amidase
VVRFRLWLATAFALSAIAGSLLRGQVSNDEEKPGDESGKSQHETRASSSPTPKKSPKPRAKAKAATSKSKKKRTASPTPEKSPSPIPKAELATEESGNKTDASVTPKESPHSNKTKGSAEEEEETPKPKPTETPESTVAPKKSRKSPTPTPKSKGAKKKSQKKKASSKGKKASKAKATRKEKETPEPEKTPTPPPEKAAAPSEDSSPPPPRAVAVPTPAVSPRAKVPRAAPAEERAQVVIEKSGIEEDQGFEPPPPPPPRKGFWPWSLSRPKAYRYLTSSVIEAIRRAPVKRRRWQFIVVHNSGTRQGNARAFDYYHRNVRRMRNGLAYHFVIGNGTSSGNGQIEVGDRWRRQINGGHVHSDYLNNISLGICLVGDFNRDQPTRAELESCEELIRYLRERCGKVGMRSIIVRPHREMNPPRWATDCPGDDFPYSWFRRF